MAENTKVIMADCEDIRTGLLKYAYDKDANIKEVWFNLKKVKPWIDKGAKYGSKEEPLDDPVINNPDDFSSESYKITQKYDIEVYKKEQLSLIYLRVVEEATCVVVEFATGFDTKSEDRGGEILDFIKEMMAYFGVIFFRSDAIDKDVLEFVKKIKFPVQAPFSILIYKVPRMVVKTPSTMKNLMEEEFVSKHDGKVVPPPYGLYGVLEDEAIACFTKADIEVSGRNAYGTYVKSGLSDDLAQKYAIDEAKVKIEDEETSINYTSLIKGYIGIDGYDFRFQVIDKLVFSSINDVDAPALLNGKDKELDIIVDGDDDAKFAIGENVSIECRDLEVDGDVNSNVAINALSIKVEGNVSANTELQANKVEVYSTKGAIKGDDVSVEKADEARIVGKSVKVLRINLCKVMGENVLVNEFDGGNDIIFSKSLHLKNIKGEDNKITITADVSEDIRALVGSTNARLKVKRDKLHALEVDFKKRMLELYNQKDAIARLEEQIRSQQRKNAPIQDYIKKTYIDYKGYITKTRTLKDAIIKEQESIEETTKAVANIDAPTLEAKITTESPWKNNIEVRYNHIYPPASHTMRMSDDQRTDICIDPTSLRLKCVPPSTIGGASGAKEGGAKDDKAKEASEAKK